MGKKRRNGAYPRSGGSAAPAQPEPRTMHLQVPLPARRYPMIGLPIYAGGMPVNLFHSLAAASTECLERGWEPPYVMFRTMDSVITRARNAILAHFLQKTECTDLVFVDGDISWAPGCFARLLSHPVELVAGAYRARGEVGGEAERYPIRPLQNELVVNPEHGLMEVEGAPTGFMRISRAAALKMVEAYGGRWYRDEGTAPGLKLHCIFDFEYVPHDDGEGGTYFSEDFTFCRRWRALGGKVWVDPQLTLHHLGEKLYSGKLMEYLNRKHLERHPPPPVSLAAAARTLLVDAGNLKETPHEPAMA